MLSCAVLVQVVLTTLLLLEQCCWKEHQIYMYMLLGSSGLSKRVIYYHFGCVVEGKPGIMVSCWLQCQELKLYSLSVLK